MDPYPPTPSHDERTPKCVVCGYQLAGLRVDGFCPECGTLIVRSIGGSDSRPNGYAIASLVLGICGIVLGCSTYGIIGLICGPLALVYHAKAVAKVRDGLASSSTLGLAQAGRVCGWIALGMGLLVIALIASMLLIGAAIPFLTSPGGGGGGFGP